ncbi:hypothetical protein ACWDV4_06960 [Micromonospora sp. NPDC003197]
MGVEPRYVRRQARIGAFVAIAVTILCAIVTLLVAAVTVYSAVLFAADHELTGSAWLVVLFLALLSVISGVATTYLGRRGVRQLRPHG